MSSVPTFAWTRYWYRQGDTPVRAGDYLVPPDMPSDWLTPIQTASVKTLAQLANVPCLILLGDPGTGKSSEIATEAARLSKISSGVIVKSLDLKLRNEALIEKEAFKSEEFVGWTEGKHALALFFDSMDECWRRVPELGPVILAELKPHLKKPLPPLFLRLGCRAAEWRTEVENDLRSAFTEKEVGEKVQIWELAPLMESDVREAAKASALEEDHFLAQVNRLEVNAFAAHPITLRMLLATAKNGGPLGRDRAEIYQKGCGELCRDHYESGKGRPRLSSTAPDRLACASYLAVLSVVSNRYIIFGSAEQQSEETAGTFPLLDVLGQKTLIPGVTVELTREVLLETLRTGLFDAQAGDLFYWRHQSYAEYLAARYLQLRGIPPSEVVQLLCDTSTGQPRLWPQVEETACWIAPLVPDVFNLLVSTNAEVFVRCDPARLDPQQRARIVAGYLKQVRSHEAQSARGGDAIRFNRLAYPDLVQQLTPALADAAEDFYVRDLAVDIARACEVRELDDLLLKIAFTPGENLSLRRSAADALRHWVDAAIRTKVRAKIQPELLDDNDVRGCVLEMLWPGTLTEEELVPFLIQPARDYVGMYQLFLSGPFVSGLSQANLVPLIKWARLIAEDSDDYGHQHFEGAGCAVLYAAFRSIDEPNVRAEFMLAVRDYLKNHRGPFKHQGRNFSEEEPQRRIFWREIVAGDLPVLETAGSLRESGLATEDDFDWVIEEAVAAGDRERSRWCELALWHFRPLQKLEQIARLQFFAETDADFASRLQRAITSPLFEASGRLNWQREQYYKDEELKATRSARKPFSQIVDEFLTNYEVSDEPNWIWGLVNFLNHHIVDSDETDARNAADVGWERLTDKHRTRLRKLSPRFISSVTVNTIEVYDTKNHYRSYVASVTFLLDLVEFGSSWPTSQPKTFWETWTPVIFQYRDKIHRPNKVAWQQLLKLAFERAKPVFLTALRRWLAESNNHWVNFEALEGLPIGSDAELENILLSQAVNTRSENSSKFDFFSLLLRHQSASAESTLLSWLPVAGEPNHETGPFADAVLLCARPESYAPPAVNRILNDANWGRSVFSYLAGITGVRSSWLEFIDSEHVAKLWEWLDREFPGDPYDKEGDGTVTPNHEIARFRSYLITYLQKRGTEDVVDAFRGLLARHPQHHWIGRVLAETREIVRRESWKPPTTAAIIAYLAQTGIPPFCNSADLAHAVRVSLARYQALLKEPNPATELWNETGGPVKTWTPKDEENVSDCLARHLERDLRQHQVRVAREAELRQQTGEAPGDEPDLIVTAPNASGTSEKLTVIVEVKCSWNVETVSGMEQQLLNRYLRSARCGIYVVAHFNCPSWSKTDPRRRKGFSKKSFIEIDNILQAEHKRLSLLTSKRLDLVLLDTSV